MPAEQSVYGTPLKVQPVTFPAPFRISSGLLLQDSLASLNAGNSLSGYIWSIDGTLNCLSGTGAGSWTTRMFYLNRLFGMSPREMYASLMVRTSATGGYSAFMVSGLGDGLNPSIVEFRSGDNAIVIGDPGANWGSVAFTWAANTWYSVKIQIEGTRYRIRVWQDGTAEPGTWNLDFTADTLNRVRHLGTLGFTVHTNTWFFKNLLICSGAMIYWYNLVGGQKVELYNAQNSLLASVTVGANETVARIDVSGISLPVTNGYFKIYDTNGIALLRRTPVYDQIWAGSDYYWQSGV